MLWMLFYELIIFLIIMVKYYNGVNKEVLVICFLLLKYNNNIEKIISVNFIKLGFVKI